MRKRKKILFVQAKNNQELVLMIQEYALVDAVFPVKAVFNIINRNSTPQPLFRVELEPNSRKLKEN